jgi:hypothetical protein
MGTKLIELLLIEWLRKNMINDYLRERACIESVRGSFEFFDFEVCFALFLGLLLFVLSWIPNSNFVLLCYQ